MKQAGGKGPGNQGPNKNPPQAFLICLLVTLVGLSFLTEIRKAQGQERTYEELFDIR